MLIMKINGGLASQLRKYIIGYQIAKELSLEYAIDLSEYYNGYFRPYYLCYLNVEDTYYINDTRLVKKCYSIRNGQDMQKVIDMPKKFNYYIGIEDAEYIDFLNKHKEFDIRDDSEIIKSIRLKYDSQFFSIFKEKISKHFSVAVHIRLGDFEKLNWNEDYDYYKTAIIYIKEKYNDAHFYFFSNDIHKTHKIFGDKSFFHYVNAMNGYLGDVEELFCMAACDLRILSNASTYGKLANTINRAQFNKSIKYNALINASNSDNSFLNHTFNINAKNDDFFPFEYKKYNYSFDKAIYKSEKHCDYRFDATNLNDFLTDGKYLDEDQIIDILKLKIEKCIKENNLVLLNELWECYHGDFNFLFLKYIECLKCDYKDVTDVFIKKVNGLQDISFCTFDKIGKWTIKGVYRIAKMLSKLGYNVGIKVLFNNKLSEFVKDVDGKRLGFKYDRLVYAKNRYFAFDMFILEKIWKKLKSVIKIDFQFCQKYLFSRNDINLKMHEKISNICSPIDIIKKVEINELKHIKLIRF